MTRARALALAAQAVNAASTEPEAATAARILARLIHENPDLLAPVPWVAIGDPPEGASAIDPIVGFAVREAVTMAGDLFRDFMARGARGPKPVRTCLSCARAPDPGGLFCSVCRVVPRDAPTPAPNGAPRPGPRKAASPKRVRPRGRP